MEGQKKYKHREFIMHRPQLPQNIHIYDIYIYIYIVQGKWQIEICTTCNTHKIHINSKTHTAIHDLVTCVLKNKYTNGKENSFLCSILSSSSSSTSSRQPALFTLNYIY